MDDFFDIAVPEIPIENAFEGVDLDLQPLQDDNPYAFENEPVKSHPPPFYRFRKQPTIEFPKWVLDVTEKAWKCGDLVVYQKDIPPNTNKRPRFTEMYLKRFLQNSQTK